MHNPAKNDHPIIDVLRERWSPRAFADKPVDPAALRRMLEAARWAASSYNEQPWRYMIATRENPAEFQKMLSTLVEQNQAWARNAPVLMLSLMSTSFQRNAKPNRVALHDVGAASAQLTAQATHEGLVVHQMAGIEVEKIKQVYQVPAGFEPVAALAIGYEGKPDSLPPPLKQAEVAPRSRKPLPEIVFAGKFGDAAPIVKV